MVVLGDHLRHFKEVTSSHFATKETQQEYAARVRAESQNVAASGRAPSSSAGRRPRTFTLKRTIKAHFLGDYPSYVRENGTTDNYTMQIVSRPIDLNHAAHYNLLMMLPTCRASNGTGIPRLSSHVSALKTPMLRWSRLRLYRTVCVTCRVS